MKLKLIVFTLLILLQSLGQAAPDSDVKTRACIDCHGHESMNISALQIEKCDSCHALTSLNFDTMKNSASILNKVSSSHSTENKSNPIRGHTEASSPAKPLTPGAGMRYPLYYQGTRMGDTPNEMVLIKAGGFVMGTNNRLPDEGPEHRVTLVAFYIDKYEVTNLQYKKFNNATQRRSPRHFRNRTFPEGKADHPVTYVSWLDAFAYCQWANKRLPSDQEWERAARGTQGRSFPWGNEFAASKANTPLRWKQIGKFGDTTPVGAFTAGATAEGIYDMSGNVWEWTDSWYHAYPGNKTPSESYGERYKTLKGGSWFNCSFYNCGISAPVFNRAFFAKRVKNDSFGFRCAQDIGK
ncbi:MAG: formylglycine-generating enzyme family protein [Thiohalomonadales bacterium]